MPQVLDSIHPEKMIALNDEESCLAIMKSIASPHRDVFLWMLDLMCLVVAEKSVNKMNAQNCAIVMGPNLFSTSVDGNPMQALMLSQKAVFFMKCVLAHRCRSVYGMEST